MPRPRRRHFVILAFALAGGCKGLGGDGGGSGGAESLGCTAPTSCNKGEFVGSIRVSSEADMAMIAGHTKISGWLEVYESEARCVEFLACMEDVGRDVSVFGNASLESLHGLDALKRVGSFDDGNINISSNPGLTDLSGVEGLEVLPGSLNISKHGNLQTVSGFQNLKSIGFDIIIRENTALSDLSGLHDLDAVEGRFIVTQNPELCLSEIETVGADLAVGPDGGSTASNREGC